MTPENQQSLMHTWKEKRPEIFNRFASFYGGNFEMQIVVESGGLKIAKLRIIETTDIFLGSCKDDGMPKN
jgi:hypothetical protein